MNETTSRPRGRTLWNVILGSAVFALSLTITMGLRHHWWVHPNAILMYARVPEDAAPDQAHFDVYEVMLVHLEDRDSLFGWAFGDAFCVEFRFAFPDEVLDGLCDCKRQEQPASRYKILHGIAFDKIRIPEDRAAFFEGTSPEWLSWDRRFQLYGSWQTREPWQTDELNLKLLDPYERLSQRVLEEFVNESGVTLWDPSCFYDWWTERHEPHN